MTPLYTTAIDKFDHSGTVELGKLNLWLGRDQVRLVLVPTNVLIAQAKDYRQVAWCIPHSELRVFLDKSRLELSAP